MEFLKKNKIIVGVVAVILLGLGLWYFVLPKSGGGIQPVEEAQNVKEITPEEVGLSLEVVKNGQAVEMTLDKLDGIKSVEYELSYDAEEEDPESGETAVVPKGAVGSPIDVAGESSITREILLGTCSANKCRYDKVQGDIKIILKVTYENGDVGQVEMTIPYESE